MHDMQMLDTVSYIITDAETKQSCKCTQFRILESSIIQQMFNLIIHIMNVTVI